MCDLVVLSLCKGRLTSSAAAAAADDDDDDDDVCVCVRASVRALKDLSSFRASDRHTLMYHKSILSTAGLNHSTCYFAHRALHKRGCSLRV